MYGTVAKLRVKSGHLEAFKAWAEVAESRPVPGFISTTIYQMDSDPQNLILVIQFTDRAAYQANAENPEQHQFFLQMMLHLEAEPEWNDGEVIAVLPV